MENVTDELFGHADGGHGGPAQETTRQKSSAAPAQVEIIPSPQRDLFA
jgi:hypothetical protein